MIRQTFVLSTLIIANSKEKTESRTTVIIQAALSDDAYFTCKTERYW
jgi:hypothetical protein